VVIVLDSFDSYCALSMWVSWMWFGTCEVFGPSSSVAGIVYNFGFCFNILVASFEALYSWVGRPLDGHLVISICGLDKFDYFRMGVRCM